MLRFLLILLSKDKTFSTTGDLIEHLNSDHGHDLKTATQTLQSGEIFMKWKVLEEKNVEILVRETEGRQENKTP